MYLPRSRIPTISELRAFEASARCGSFTAAAHELDLSQSAISKQIQQLELTLGRDLFNREKQRISLTAAGELYVESVRDVLNRLEWATQTAYTAGDIGPLKIASTPAFAIRWLIPNLRNFTEAHNEIEVEIVSNMSSRVRTFSLAEDLVDLAIQYNGYSFPGGRSVRLFEEEVVVVASPDYRDEVQLFFPQDLKRARLLNQSTRPLQWSLWFRKLKIDVDDNISGPVFDQLLMTIEAAVCGHGVALVPSFLVRNEIRQGMLCNLFNEAYSFGSAYHLVIPNRKKDVPRIRQLAAWLVETVEKDGLRKRQSRSS